MLNYNVKLAFIKALYQSENDLISMYSYFTLQCIENSGLNVTSVQKQMEDQFGIKAPLDLIRTLIKKLKKKEFVNYNNDYILLTDLGKIEFSKLKRGD